MLVERVNETLDEYPRLLSGIAEAAQQGDSVLVITSTLNRNNDCMSILIGVAPDGGYVISDLGETIADLELSGFSLSSKQLEDKLQMVLRDSGVFRTDGNEIYVCADIDELAPKTHVLLRAMSLVDQLAKG